MDIALVADERQQTFTVHRVDCTDARAAADRGVPVMSMFGVNETAPILREYDWHECMQAPVIARV